MSVTVDILSDLEKAAVGVVTAALGVTSGGTLLVTLGAIAADEVLQITKLRQLGPDEAANIAALAQAASVADSDTMQRINQWRAAHGLSALQSPKPEV